MHYHTYHMYSSTLESYPGDFAILEKKQPVKDFKFLFQKKEIYKILLGEKILSFAPLSLPLFPQKTPCKTCHCKKPNAYFSSSTPAIAYYNTCDDDNESCSIKPCGNYSCVHSAHNTGFKRRLIML